MINCGMRYAECGRFKEQNRTPLISGSKFTCTDSAVQYSKRYDFYWFRAARYIAVQCCAVEYMMTGVQSVHEGMRTDRMEHTSV
jgi:hypothetical protein